jgi:HAD superfamily hydrolase (TIGR01509 family)
VTPELVIFDCDGVLVDSETISNQALASVLEDIGLPMGYEETRRAFIGRSMQSCLEIIERRLGAPVPEDFVSRYYARMFAAFERDLRPVPGVAEVLDGLEAPFCVASSGSHEKIRKTLGVTGLLPRFEGRIFSATEVERGKPAPDLFLHAARAMGADPYACAVVEDSVLGVEAGVAAGMRVLGYAAASDPGALASAGARVFQDMAELPVLLNGA